MYGPTLDFVTKVRPVSVSGGSTSPPVRLNRYRYSVGRKPWRYGSWLMVKLIWPFWIAVSVPGVRSNPPAGMVRPTALSCGPSSSVDPASTAQAATRPDLLPSRNAFSALPSADVEAPVATDFTV